MRVAIFMIVMVGACGCAAYRVPKPEMVTRQQWGSHADAIADSRRQEPVWITIHHAGEVWHDGADPAEFVRKMQEWGKRRPQLEKPPRNTYWPDLPYHFLIAPDGRIFEGRPVEYEPESNTRYSVNGNVGIEMMGDFEVQRPSEAQLRACVQLTAWLCQRYKIDLNHVRGHRDAAPGQTSCPGKDFYRYLQDGEFRKWVDETMHGREANVREGPAMAGGPTTRI